MVNQQAEKANEQIIQGNPNIYELLSKKGRGIYFPKSGILAQSAQAKGKEINATIGIALEDDCSPIALPEILDKIELKPEKVFPYAPSYGNNEIRNKWKEMIYKKNPSLKGKVFSNPVVSVAITHGLSILGYLFVNEGDKIILPSLYYGNYNLIFKEAYGAEFLTYELFNEENKFNLIDFEKTISEEKSDKKIILLNFPNNPTGYSPSEEEVEEISNIILKEAKKGTKLLVICDDAYFGLVFEEGISKQSIFTKLADLHENILAVKLDGITKEDYAWGFRVGFISYACKKYSKELLATLEDKTAGAIRGNISNAPNISQSLIMEAFNSPNYDKNKYEKYQLLKKRYDISKEILENNPKYKEFFNALPYNSGYFLCVRLKENLDANKIRLTLLEKYDTGLISIGKDLLRIAFSSTPTPKIAKMFENIYSACKNA